MLLFVDTVHVSESSVRAWTVASTLVARRSPSYRQLLYGSLSYYATPIPIDHRLSLQTLMSSEPGLSFFLIINGQVKVQLWSTSSYDTTAIPIITTACHRRQRSCS